MSSKKSNKNHSPIPPAVAGKPAAPVVAIVATPAVTPAVVTSPAVQALIAALRDPSADVAREAALALGKHNVAAAVAALAEVIANAGGYFHSVVRAAACVSLGQLRDKSAVPALINAVRDPMAEASAEAVRALSLIGDDRAVPALVEVVANKSGYFLPVVRLAAVHALRPFRASPAASAALKALATSAGEDAVLRAAAA